MGISSSRGGGDSASAATGALPPRTSASASRPAIVALAGLLAAVALAGCVRRPPARPPPPPAPPPAPEARPEAGPEPQPCPAIERIEISKSERTLVARCTGGALRSFHIALGRKPIGPKRRSGDLRTPEGVYRIAGPARPSRFHLFIPIDYPSLADARRGLEIGTIDRGTYDAIASAAAEGVLPPQQTPLGGAIGLHGEGEAWRGHSRHTDWTLGCIALSDAAIEYLAERVQTGTEVRIEP